MNKENRMFGLKNIQYSLETKTLKTGDKKITTYYYAIFGSNRFAISREEYECLLETLELL